jgi:hypothetical protein
MLQIFEIMDLQGGITIESAKNEPALRPYQIAMKCWDKGFYVDMAEIPFN